ncbi:jasmonic acid-amido synthetase JAR1 [Vigna radiata var. radiata]|uniref:Jasmonic acid-amido synthetase JAR1 n=1 Tax=Vigna radiata var. radiata TaxID=3916 RepID=A0A1S3TCW5_VIGRR|nr:jasmonic acid-amido synthetase JAR1 [Vigna radiata var. radiata]
MLEKVEELNMDKVIEEFELLSKDAERVQRETLKKILEDNASAEYLQSLGLNGRTDPESFKACVPLVTHKELEPYIYRIIDGDASPILTGKPITTMSLSSGTTQGKPKYVPWNDELYETTMQIYQTSFAFRNREFPIKNGKALSFIYGSKQFKTKGGLAARTATSNVFSNAGYKCAMRALQSQCCSPDEVIFGPDFFQSLYCHLLCGLIFRDEVQFVSSTFAHSIVHAFRTFEQVWEELCTDIREGVLSSRVIVPSIRMAMSKLMKPNPKLATLIHKKCTGLSNWYGLIPELFPNAKYIYGIMTGSMEPYLKKLRHYAGELPLLTADYGSSEGWIAANVNPQYPPENATYAVLPHIGYFEFIPLSELDNTRGQPDFLCIDPQPVSLTQVKVGEEYEVVMTNPAGLYRYRLGDVVKVMGFHNSTPELKFVRRSSLLLNINIDKNTEKDLQVAVEAAAKLLAEEKTEVVDYSSHVDLSEEPGHYVIFWEISGEASEELLHECCNCLDKSFVDAGYISSRKVNCIGALELRVVRRGTFQKILDHYLGLGTAVSQYKTPRCVGPTNGVVLQILSENVVNNYRSTAF